MTGCVYHLCILCTLLSGIYASWIVHSKSATWAKAGVTCVSNNQTLVNRFDEQMIRNLTSCMNKEDLSFWTGGYTGISLTDWIAFHGCFFVNNQRSIIRKESRSHTVWSCYQLCERLMFGLMINSCVCFGNITLSLQTFEKTNYCIHGRDEFMGINGSMAIYKYAADPREGSKAASQKWCSVYACDGSRNYRSASCKNTARYKCENGFSSSEEVTWGEAVRACLTKGSFLQGTILDKRCSSTPGLRYWSYVRRFGEHKYLTRDSTWGSNIIECEIAHLNGGSFTLERTTACTTKKLPYICQLDDEYSYIYIDLLSEQWNEENDTTQFTYTSPSMNPSNTRLPPEDNSTCIPEKRRLTMYLETRTSISMESERTSINRSRSTSEVMVRAESHGTESTNRNKDVHTTEKFTQDASTHSVNIITVTKHGKSHVVIVAGSVAGILAVVAVIVVVIIVSCRHLKKKRKEARRTENVYTIPDFTSAQESVYDRLQNNGNSNSTATRGIRDEREITLELTTSSEAYEYMNLQ